METESTQQVWIYIDEGDSHHGHSVVTSILETLRTAGCPGATVLRGIGGYGVHGMLHSELLVDLPSHLPLVITFIDRLERVQHVLPLLDELVAEGMIAITPVQIRKSSRRTGGPFPRYLSVGDVMTREVVQVEPQTPLSEIVSLLLERGVRALPVVTSDQQVIGMLTDSDLLSRGGTKLPVRLQQLLSQGERSAHLASLSEPPQVAADVMTPKPVTLPATASLAQAAATMVERKLKRLPVVDQNDRLVGMVSRYDLLKTVADGLDQPLAQPVELAHADLATVGGLMLTDVPSVDLDTDLATTLERLLATVQRRVVVLDAGQQVVGIITGGDVLRRTGRRVHSSTLQRMAAWLSGATRPEGLEVALEGRTAAEIMSSPVLTVTPETPTAEAIRLMMIHKIKWLPVVETSGALRGIVGRAAVLRALGT